MTGLLPRKNIYHQDDGCNLLNEENYPREVKEYLATEKEIVTKLLHNHSTLVEVGCFDGRYHLLSKQQNKKYVGIDVVDLFLKEARRRASFFRAKKGNYEFLKLDAQNLHEIREKSKIFKETATEDILVLFPFNVLGNLENVISVINSLNYLGVPFFISSFNTTDEACRVRNVYYNNCQYDNITKTVENDGIRFSSRDGLNTIAYEPNFLIEKFILGNHNVKMIHIDSISIGLVNLSYTVDSKNIFHHLK